MKKLIVMILILSVMAQPVYAMDFTAPSAPNSAQTYMPPEDETFADGLWYIIKTAADKFMPELASASGVCLSLVAMVLLLSLLAGFSQSTSGALRLVGSVVIGLLLLDPTNVLIQLGTKTVTELCDYGKLLIPVMTAAMAAQGGITTSAALYSGTILFNAFLTMYISKVIVPAIYIYLCLCVAVCAVEQDILKQCKNFVKWFLTWSMKWVLYIFTGYLSITGIVSGTIDTAKLKVAKIGISGAVPMVGNILADATETILVSAGVMKNAAGVYGIFTVVAVCIGPFLKIGAQYLLLKFTGFVCSVFDYKPASDLITDFSSGMGMVLAMTGTVCVLLLVSLVCFMKGMG